jgi:CheY-like chemotaxis protein
MRHRHHGLVIIDMSLNDLGTWRFVQALTGWGALRRSVVVATAKLSHKTQELADQFGCAGVLSMPFEPQQVRNLLQRV